MSCKMLGLTLKRIGRAGFLNFWRSPVTALATVLTLTVTLFVIGGILLGAIYLRSSLEVIKEKVDISVSFRPESAEADVFQVKQSLSLLPEVREVTYSSREEELAEFKARNADNDLIIQSLREVGNPFGARLNIKAVDPSRYESIARFLRSDSVLSSAGEPIIDQVSFKKNVVDKLVSIIDTTETLGLAVMAVLIFISLAVTFTTVSLAIYVSRDEIALMKLVGATNRYVRGPFVVEGVIAGVLAALLATLFLYPSTLWLRNVTAGVFGGIDLASYFIENLALIFLVLLGAGILLGAISSFWAVRKHLKI